ncbi:MAG: hypothetical protein M1514_00545 [Patescibacteria group bacterium]|nr:hypothetical protein [Patescibacteria group bacterium]
MFKRQNNEIVFEAEVRYCYFEIENNLYHQGFLVSEKVPTVLVEPTAQQWEPFLDVDFFLWLEEDVRIKFLERTLDGTVSILSAILRPEPQQRRNLKEKIKMEAQSYWRHHWLDLLNQQSLCIFCDPLE